MQRHIDNELGLSKNPGWIARSERSNAGLIRFMVWIALTMGRPVARALLYPTALYFLAFSPLARKASVNFLCRALGRKSGVADSFRHFHSFSATILDRVFLLNDQYSSFEVQVHGAEIIKNMMDSGKGCFLLGAHLGSFEVIRTLARTTGDPQVSMVMYEENASKVNLALNAINPRLSLEVIALGKPASMLRVREALDRGGCIGMLGDRSIQGEGIVSCDFFGEQAHFPDGPFRVAAMLKRPIILMFGLYRGGNHYDIYFEQLTDMEQIERSNRDVMIKQSLERYVTRLEHYCRVAPYNWFNFYEFWK